MGDMHLQQPERWIAFLRDLPESGMTYQMLAIVLKDGRRFERVPHVDGRIDLTGIEGFWKVPFEGDDIAEIIVTHDRRRPPRLRK
jgi:hypothetical protein